MDGCARCGSRLSTRKDVIVRQSTDVCKLDHDTIDQRQADEWASRLQQSPGSPARGWRILRPHGLSSGAASIEYGVNSSWQSPVVQYSSDQRDISAAALFTL